MSREGFEPSTKGLKVLPNRVHRVSSDAFRCTPRATFVHELYAVGLKSTAVAVNVAVKARL